MNVSAVPSQEVRDLYAAFVAARNEARETRKSWDRQAVADIDSSSPACEEIRIKWYAAEDARTAAYRAMVEALPTDAFVAARWNDYTTYAVRLGVYQKWKRFYRAAKMWADNHQRWYAVLEEFFVDPTTGQAISVSRSMVDDAVLVADDHNADLREANLFAEPTEA